MMQPSKPSPPTLSQMDLQTMLMEISTEDLQQAFRVISGVELEPQLSEALEKLQNEEWNLLARVLMLLLAERDQATLH